MEKSETIFFPVFSQNFILNIIHILLSNKNAQIQKTKIQPHHEWSETSKNFKFFRILHIFLHFPSTVHKLVRPIQFYTTRVMLVATNIFITLFLNFPCRLGRGKWLSRNIMIHNKTDGYEKNNNNSIKIKLS